MPDALLDVGNLGKTFRARRSFLSRSEREDVEAVRGASFDLERGASLGIVGESGSGKTTLARMLIGLEQPTEGRIVLDGRELSGRPSHRERKERARLIQMVFQDPYTSLDPRQSTASALDEVQREHFSRSAAERAARTAELLDAVGLGEREGRVLPRRLSGGQRQRAAIARALAGEPSLLILDEAVSALDVSIQAQILNLLGRLREEFGLTYVLISHDLAVVRQLSDHVVVMYQGRIVESGPVETILSEPRHPYTQRLLASVPRPGMGLERRTTGLLDTVTTGCRFRARCEFAFERCEEEPKLLVVDHEHDARCWLVDGGSEPAAGAGVSDKNSRKRSNGPRA